MLRQLAGTLAKRHAERLNSAAMDACLIYFLAGAVLRGVVRAKGDPMFKRAVQLLVVVCMGASAISAADASFVGDWKLNSTKSKLTDAMKVASLGANQYSFDFGGGKPEAIMVDGTDQPAGYGTTLSVTVEGPDAWKVIRKKDGRMLLTGIWKLSPDGNTLKDNYTEFAPNGSATTVNYVYARTAGTSGFAGTWESTLETIESVYVIQVRTYEGDGLSFIDPSEEETKNVKFDGKDYPNAGRNEAPGATSSIRRVDDHRLEMTNKINGKVTATREIQLSADLKTLTMTVHMAGRSKPNILVFDRQ